jgi:predicted alpha-1,2-mannosidase
MKRVFLTLFFAGIISSSGSAQTRQPADFVRPNLGAVHGRWFFYTPASIPFGMAKLAPNTNAYGSPGGWQPCGYDDRHDSIEGFGHFHEFQIGGVVIMPTTGPIKTKPGTLESPENGYRSRFDKKDEIAQAGYYSVLLKSYGIKAELTATARVGYHRYTFPASQSARLIFDVGHRQGESSDVTEAYIRFSGNQNNEVEGYVFTYPEYVKFCDPGRRVKMYFVAWLSQSPNAIGTFTDDKIQAGATESRGQGNGMVLTFATKQGEVIELKVGLSYTSMENARVNLQKEAALLTFDQARVQAQKQWNRELGKISVEGGKEEDKIKFYTGLYHALLGRGLASDVNGQYPTNKGPAGQIPLDQNGMPRYQHYNTDGIWGGFWNLSQVWALAYPEYLSQYVQSNIDFYKETGWLHDGVASGIYSNGVQTNFMGLLIASAYQAGIRNFEVETGYQAAFKNEVEYRDRDFGSGKYDLESFVKLGYVPLKETILSNGWVLNFGASHTFEYCFSSFAVAQFAKALGKERDYTLLMNQAEGYRKLFDPETKHMRPREIDGSFMQDYDPRKAWKGFQEGNGFQYTWYVPHDIKGLMELIGRDLFNQRLETTFTESQKDAFGGGKTLDSFSGVEKLYNQGNQPCLHIAWLFNYSGKPWLTQKWTRAIADEFYGTTALHGYGYGQDEDQGQLGAWFVLAALGLFDVQGHTSIPPTFQLGSPLFDRITIQLDPKYYPGGNVVIETKNNGPGNIYVQSATLNGRPLNNCWFPRSELLAGGSLRLVMGAGPNEKWGIATPPPSLSDLR